MTRNNGYAICIGEREDEMSAVVVAVLSRSGKMIMGMSVFGPNAHFTDDFKELSIVKLSEVAKQVKESLYGDSKAD